MATQALPEPTRDTPEGTRVRTTLHIGYIPVQNRPGDCGRWAMDPNHPQKHWSSGCKHADKRCEGQYVEVTGTYNGTTYWMDNSIEGTVTLDEPAPDGRKHVTIYYKAPSGDACF